MTTARILIVEDEQAIAEVLEYNLEKEGFECSTLKRGDLAFEALKADPPDLILLDLMLPGLDGLELCRMLQREPATASACAVLTSDSSTSSA